MKHMMRLLLFVCLPLCIFAEESSAPKKIENTKPATIKVLLKKDTSGILLEAKGPFVVYNPQTGKKLSSGRKGKRYYCHPHSEGIKWGEDFLGIFQLQIEPKSPNTTFLVNGIQYRGAIAIYHIEEKLNVINQLDVESFIKSTLTHQISTPLTRDVLDSVAIIARTNAYHLALANSEAFWHTTAEEAGYHGIGLSLQNLDIDNAVDNTCYLVMTQEEAPFPSSWTEHCAGKTASYSSIFRKKIETPKGIHSPFAAKNRNDSHWSFTIETQELAKVVKTNRVTGMDLFLDHFSDKVYATRFHDGSHTEDIDFIHLQKALGKNQLKSSDFTVNIKGNIAVFEGYGEGNGVGLCLYSATQMAERGDNAPQILSTFFPSTQIEKMRSYPTALVSYPTALKKKEAAKKKHKILHR